MSQTSQDVSQAHATVPGMFTAASTNLADVNSFSESC